MRVGIVGCGFICHQHIRAIRSIRGVELAAVCDRKPELATSVAKTYSVPRTFNEIDHLLEEARPHIVHILTPPQSHRELTLKALRANCHVLVEKPMALNAHEARAMLDAARRSRGSLGICHNYRFVPAFLKARAAIDRGAVGQTLSADIFWRMSSLTPDSRPEAGDWMHKLPGGVFQEVLPHLVYLLSSLLGRLEFVSAVTNRYGDRPATDLRVLFTSDHGPATLGLSLHSNPVQKFVRIYGTNATLHVDLATSVLLRLHASRDTMVSRTLVNLLHVGQLAVATLGNAVLTLTGRLRRGHETLISAYYEAVARGAAPPVTAEEGLATVALLDQIWDALASEGTLREQA